MEYDDGGISENSKYSLTNLPDIRTMVKRGATVYRHSVTGTAFMKVGKYKYFETRMKYWREGEQYRVPGTFENLTGWVSFDDPTSIAMKAAFAKSRNLRGVFCWSMSSDWGKTLIDAARRAFLPPGVPSFASFDDFSEEGDDFEDEDDFSEEDDDFEDEDDFSEEDDDFEDED
eukprot:733171_1